MNIQKMGTWASLLSFAMPLISFAQTVTVQTLPTGPTDVPGLLGKVCTVANIMFTALLVLAIVFIIMAAFKYLTAGGDAEKVTEANHQILYAAVAVAIGIFAKVVPIIVGTFFVGNQVDSVC